MPGPSTSLASSSARALALGEGVESFGDREACACDDAVNVSGAVAGGPEDRAMDGHFGHTGTVSGQLGRRTPEPGCGAGEPPRFALPVTARAEG